VPMISIHCGPVGRHRAEGVIAIAMRGKQVGDIAESESPWMRISCANSPHCAGFSFGLATPTFRTHALLLWPTFSTRNMWTNTGSPRWPVASQSRRNKLLIVRKAAQSEISDFENPKERVRAAGNTITGRQKSWRRFMPATTRSGESRKSAAKGVNPDRLIERGASLPELTNHLVDGVVFTPGIRRDDHRDDK